MADMQDLFSQVDAMEDEIIALEQALVRIPSVNTGFMPTGNETPVCELVRDYLAEDRIDSEILESAPNRGNLIARLEGRSGKSGLMFMSHTDVVPVEDEAKWQFPPFSATIHDGRIFGRGASDCKGLLTCQLVAVRLLKRNGILLEDGLILAAGADEEHGGRYGFGWLADNHPEKLAAPFAINEGGGTPIKAAGALTYILGVGEKGRLQVEIDIKGTSSHASVPWQGTNALYRLSSALNSIEVYSPERDTSTAIFDHLSDLCHRGQAFPHQCRRNHCRHSVRKSQVRLHASSTLADDADTHNGPGGNKVQQRSRVHPAHLRRSHPSAPGR